MNTYIIYTKRLALELRKRGFKIISIGVNENHPQYDTYMFEDTQALRNAITEITQ